MSEGSSTRWTWSRLVWAAPAVLAAVLLVVLVAVGFELFTIIITIIMAAIAFVGRRFPRRAGPITVLVIMALLLLLESGSIAGDLAHPESFLNFAVFAVIPTALALVAIVASVAVLTSRSNRIAAGLGAIALIVIVVGTAVSAVATLGVEDDTAAPGDLVVTAKDVAFSPTSLTASGDSIGVFVDNEDPIRHTFKIEGADVEVELPANTARRVDLHLAPGTYQFHCTVPGHEDMKGTLVVGG